jgi:hypothetical protein
MKRLSIFFMLIASPSFAQNTIPFTTAPAVAPTTGTPTDAEVDNAYGICQAHRSKDSWQFGYENCDAVQKSVQSRIETSHQSTVQDVAKRLK